MSNYNRQHAADFAEWRIRHPHEVVNTPEEAGITSTLKVGDKVKRGQVIAYVGTSGYVTGAHLNLNIYENNTAVDPMGYFK